MQMMTGKPYSQELIDRMSLNKLKGIDIKPSAQSEILFKMKPKIPSKGKSLYRGFYIRSLDKSEFIYHIETGIFVARMNKLLKQPMEAKSFIDDRYDEIIRRINELDV